MEELTEFLHSHMEIVYVVRIVLASLCGGIIGVERTLRQKDAGFRTHIIVAMGAAILLIISKYGFFDVVVYDSIQLDASRIGSTIITGFSFLCAGIIFVKGLSIKGLTTAAGIVVTAAIGMAIGAGLYIVGFVSVLILLLVQITFHKFLIGFDKVLANDNLVPVIIQIENTPESVTQMKEFLKSNSVHIFDSTVDISADNKILTIRLNVQFEKDVDIDDVLSRYLECPGVTQAFSV